MTAWCLAFQVAKTALVAAVRMVVAQAAAEVQLVAERNRRASARAVRSRVMPKIEIRAANLWLSCKSIFPRL
jgi:hypothetical protein